MKSDAMWWLGQAAGCLVGVFVGMSYGVSAGVAVGYATLLLVDIRHAVMTADERGK